MLPALGHSLKDVSDWVKFAKFAESNLDRKLDIKRILKITRFRILPPCPTRGMRCDFGNFRRDVE